LRRFGVSGDIPFAEARARSGLSQSTIITAGLPCGGDGSVADSFLGMQATGRDQGKERSLDEYERISEICFLRAKLSAADCAVLDAAISCRHFKDLAERPGTYEQRAKPMLLAAAKKLSEIQAKARAESEVA
jgi:hypothetical protein